MLHMLLGSRKKRRVGNMTITEDSKIGVGKPEK